MVAGCAERPAEASRVLPESNRLRSGRTHPPPTGTWRKSSCHTGLRRKRNILTVWGEPEIGTLFAYSFL